MLIYGKNCECSISQTDGLADIWFETKTIIVFLEKKMFTRTLIFEKKHFFFF
jgi:hypothetical protein